MAMKKSVWDMILKVVIAVASALAGVLGANAMNLNLQRSPSREGLLFCDKLKQIFPLYGYPNDRCTIQLYYNDCITYKI